MGLRDALLQCVPQLGAMRGATIGPYTLGKKLGRGATGIVREGKHVQTGEIVAVKCVSKALMIKRKSLKSKIDMEMAVLRLLDSPHVTNLIDVHESETHVYIVMEKVDGGEFFDYLIKHGPLTESEGLFFFRQIMLGLHCCHEHYVCHRDLKPENVLVSKDKQLKLCDFGFANVQKKDTLMASICGSPHYASPEVLGGEKYEGRKADIWSAGVVLYAILANGLPFDDATIPRLIERVRRGRFRFPSSVPSEARDLIQRMIVVDPNERLTTRQVLQHEWVTRTRVDPNPCSVVIDFNLNMEDIPCAGTADVNDEIISILMHMRWRSRRDIEEELFAVGPSLVKALYGILKKRWAERPRLAGPDSPRSIFSPRPAAQVDTSQPLRRDLAEVPQTPRELGSRAPLIANAAVDASPAPSMARSSPLVTSSQSAGLGSLPRQDPARSDLPMFSRPIGLSVDVGRNEDVPLRTQQEFGGGMGVTAGTQVQLDTQKPMVRRR